MLAVSLEGKAIVLGLCQYPLVPTPLAAFPLLVCLYRFCTQHYVCISVVGTIHDA